MQRTSRIVTVVLAVLALLLWVALCIHASSPLYNPSHFASFVYPAWFAAACTVAALTGWVLMTLGERHGDGETRCRKCRHILRGLSAPRCPECGEPI
ncbi:MAG: hypothetical protein HY763_14490 [Planctomycetes bacterium]|nr:hypothetical protein [Planctomycetota bacterium]